MHGLYLSWWVQEKHVAAPIVAALLAAGDVAIAVLEVPTGWLADRFGHRASLIAGSLAQFVGMCCCWLGEGPSGVLFAILLVAVGDTFRSGADQALLYRSCVAIGREGDFQRIESRSRAAQLSALVVLVLAGGLIVARWGYDAGWIAESALSAVGLLIAAALREPPAAIADRTEPPDDIGLPTEGAGLPVPALHRLAMTIVPASLLGASASAISFFVQTADGGEPARLTAIVAAVTFAEAAGSLLAAKIASSVRVQLSLAALGVATVTLALIGGAAIVPVAVALAFLDGIAVPLRAALIQRAASDGVRARMASVASACDKIITTVALVAAGGASRRGRTS